MPRTPTPEASSLPDLHCACANLRRAARLVTQLYSHEMGETVEPTQFALLSGLKELPGAGQSPLGRMMGLDKTTLSRNLRVMERSGWIEQAASGDRRERGFRLTTEGARVLAAAKPGWNRAQAKLSAALKASEWEAMTRVIAKLSDAAVSAQRED